jgi:HK97 family phage prohead protease
MQFDIETVTADAQQQWAASPELREEFGGDFTRFAAYARAHARGGVRSVRATVTSAADLRSAAKLHGVRLEFDATNITAGSIVRLDAARGRGRISGYGAVFGTVNRRNFKLMAGAFTRSQHSVPLPMLWLHREPIGRWHEVQQDEHGLRLQGELNLDVELGRRALAHVEHGDTLGLSIGFAIGKAAGAVVERGNVLEVHEGDLLECSVVPAAAEPLARIDRVQ